MTKHTSSREELVQATKGSLQSASLDTSHYFRTKQTERQRENSRLIAAAPEMLAQLEKVQSLFARIEMSKEYTRELVQEFHNISRLLAKIEGKES